MDFILCNKMEVDNVINALESGDIKYLDEHQAEVGKLTNPFKYVIHEMSGRSFRWLIQHGSTIGSKHFFSYQVGAAGNKNIIRQLIKLKLFAISAYSSGVQQQNFDFIEWLWDVAPIDNITEINSLIISALINEKFDIFTFLIDKATEDGFDISKDYIIKGIQSVRALDWLTEHGYKFTCDQLDEHLDLFVTNDWGDINPEIINDNFMVLKWLDKHQCKINPKFIEYAAAIGALDVLKWVYTNKISSIKLNNVMLFDALIAGHIETADWLYSIGIRLNNEQLLDAATNVLDSDMLGATEWLHDHGYQFSIDDLYESIRENPSYKVMNYLDDIGVRGDDIKMMDLINDVSLIEIPEYVLWLYNHNYPIPKNKLAILKQIQNERHKG